MKHKFVNMRGVGNDGEGRDFSATLLYISRQSRFFLDLCVFVFKRDDKKIETLIDAQ